MASARDPQVELHKQWLGFVQPQGLVVSPLVLVEAQAVLATNVLAAQKRLVDLLIEAPVSVDRRARVIPSFPRFVEQLLEWRPSDLVPADACGVEVVLPEYHETLRPSFAVRDPDPPEGGSAWLLLVQVLPHGTDLDARAYHEDDRRWQATHQARFERLLRESGVPVGCLCNGTDLRLVYAPSGESAGHLTFPVAAMAEVAGRPILSGLCLLLDADRLFVQPRERRLPALLEKSRKVQNQVSTALAGQVLEALHELLRGFQAADADRQGALLRDVLHADPDEVYGGLLSVILRLIFVLYAEDRSLLGSDPVWQGSYSLLGLFERLREDHARYPDTMDQRFSAWAQVVVLFRLLHDGARHGKLRLPPRHGNLFDPDRFPFLEGRPRGEARQHGAVLDLPRISDGVVWRVLQDLLLLDGERISYRTLDVEQIGSVYETMMGFRLEVTRGPSLAIKPKKPHGAPAVIDLTELLAVEGGKRNKWLGEHGDQKLSGEAEAKLKGAATPEDLHEALGRKVSPLTKRILPPGTMVLQPSDARRKSGSHYTPRSLTEGIVRTTLEPILGGPIVKARDSQLGEDPTPEQILSLKVCDPAMGSGAFLVEACRQLGDRLVAAWHRHGALPKIPPDEDEFVHARRIVAQRCLYGVDRNPFATDLAKLSLWLATFAKDHPFTFLDHALRCGDSLVGLSRAQLRAFHWDLSKRGDLVGAFVDDRVEEAMALRQEIQRAGDGADDDELRRTLRDADEALDDVRLLGDLVVAAFFAGDSKKARAEQRDAFRVEVEGWRDSKVARQQLRAAVDELHADPKGIRPFHWEIEFPEVFAREPSRRGFDAFVGNPPFAGKNSILDTNRAGYLDWLKAVHEESHGNADLVAHFFRRAFDLLRQDGTFGLIATKTIRQGDTRGTGLRWICTHGGEIYAARRRHKWVGTAAVVVSVVHVLKGSFRGERRLDGRAVPAITAFLFHDGGHEDPARLRANAGKSFQGSIALGMGFTFDDASDEATPIAEMERLLAANPKNREVVFPYIGGEEVNDSPTQEHRRYVINFGDRSEEEARQGWPELMRIVEEKVKPKRDTDNRAVRAKYWWQFAERAPALYAAIRGLDRVLAIARISNTFAFLFSPAGVVLNEKMVVFPFRSFAAFGAMQSRVHEVWTRFFSTTLKDDLQYTPDRCFETFPFPAGFETDPALEQAGRAYYEFRAQLMLDNNEGLTKTYNRFHDRDEPSPAIAELRRLHAAIDRVVLDAYRWQDLVPTHDYILDYEDDGDDDDSDSGRPRKRKKPWRYRWPDDFRDEVLMRLLRLNRDRGEEEKLHSPPPKPPRAKGGRNKQVPESAGGLFDARRPGEA